MKILIFIIASFFVNSALSSDITRRGSGSLTYDVLSNTPAAIYDGYGIITFDYLGHKVVAIQANNSRYHTEFCDQINKNNEIGQQCTSYDPEPIFAEWDAAQGAGNVTLGAVLTNAEAKQYQAHWFYQVYVANDLNSLYNELVADLTLTDSQRRERYFGSCRAYEFDDANCASFVTIRFDTGRRPRANEMLMTKVPGRFKKMIEEMNQIIIE